MSITGNSSPLAVHRHDTNALDAFLYDPVPRQRIRDPPRRRGAGRTNGTRFRRREAYGFNSHPVHPDAAETPDPDVPLPPPPLDALSDPPGASEAEAEPPSRDADAALAYALCEATRAGQ